MKPPEKHQRGATIACPHCQSRAIVRWSEQQSPLVRELRFRCEDELCGHTFVAELSILRTLVPSQKPNPMVHLPVVDPNYRKVGRQPGNDDHRDPANDPGIPDPGDAQHASG